jgi:predicted nucleic acid-binding protein
MPRQSRIDTPGALHHIICRGIEQCKILDANYDYVLACAAEAKADFLVTGDDDLLTLVSYGKAKIIRPRDFEILFGD